MIYSKPINREADEWDIYCIFEIFSTPKWYPALKPNPSPAHQVMQARHYPVNFALLYFQEKGGITP
jgi:hypothetical protein